MTRIERLQAIATEYDVKASIRELRGEIYANINGSGSFIVKGLTHFDNKCEELKGFVAPVPIDLTARIANIEDRTIEWFR